MRALHVVGASYILLCGATVFANRTTPPAPIAQPKTSGQQCRTPAIGSTESREWFCSVKPNCNALEVSLKLQQNPPPKGWAGDAYAASCLALAGKFDEARATLDASSDPRSGARVLFAIGHPIADAGDDVAAGAIMDMVVAHWPENYQAVYHAGMSAYGLNDFEKARTQLTQFRQMYKSNDFFGNNADRALTRMAQGLGPEGPNPGAH